MFYIFVELVLVLALVLVSFAAGFSPRPVSPRNDAPVTAPFQFGA